MNIGDHIAYLKEYMDWIWEFLKSFPARSSAYNSWLNEYTIISNRVYRMESLIELGMELQLEVVVIEDNG